MAEMNLKKLLATMEPRLHPDVYVFACVPTEMAWSEYPDAWMAFREREGTTLVLERNLAESYGLDASFPSRMITLEAHSALAAVGFLAAVTGCLAELGVPVNPVSAYFHDHLFVPESQAERAMAALRSLMRHHRADAE